MPNMAVAIKIPILRKKLMRLTIALLFFNFVSNSPYHL